jgi:hypothetical protein
MPNPVAGAGRALTGRRARPGSRSRSAEPERETTVEWGVSGEDGARDDHACAQRTMATSGLTELAGV